MRQDVYRGMDSDHCFTMAMEVLQLVRTSDEKANMRFFGFNPRLRENACEGVFFLFSETAFRLLTEAGRRTSLQRPAPHTAVLRSYKTDWDQLDCRRCCSHDYRTADVREAPPTHHGSRNYPGSEPRARKDSKKVNLINVQTMLMNRRTCRSRHLHMY